MEPLTTEEVRRAVFASYPHKAPGIDGLLAIVWQHLWPVLGHHIFELFNLCIRLSKLPQEWKAAKMVPLRKPDRPDYSVAGA